MKTAKVKDNCHDNDARNAGLQRERPMKKDGKKGENKNKSRQKQQHAAAGCR